MTETTPAEQAERRTRYASAMARRDGDTWPTAYESDEADYLRRADAAIAVADAEQAGLLTRIAELESSCRDTDRLRTDWVEIRDRAERAESAVARVRSLHDHLDSETDLLTSPDQEITRGAAARKIAAALDGYSPPSDRAAILCEVEGVVRAEIHACGYSLDAGCEFCNGVTTVLEKVRRLADAASGPGQADGETQQDETQAEPEPRHTCLDQTTAPGRDWDCQYCSTLPESIDVTPAAVSQPDGEA
jgi:hypothetical protein